MPELPDIEVYCDGLRRRILHERLMRIEVKSPFVLRTADPPIESIHGHELIEVMRLGKRLVFAFEDDLFLVLHLMIAGRLRWNEAPEGADSVAESARSGRIKFRPRGKIELATLYFPNGTLLVTEAGTRKRASLHLVRGVSALAAHDRGGAEPLEITLRDFAECLRRENHTLKRALSDPRLFAGIGNAYSDEILHTARLSPVHLTSRLNDEQVARLHTAMQLTLRHWCEELRGQFSERFPGPGDITAFREGFAAHGRFNQPCPVCGSKIQRIRYADHETNYCPRCQTGGRLLADRSLSRLLKKDWPATIEELEDGP